MQYKYHYIYNSIIVIGGIIGGSPKAFNIKTK